MENQSYLQSTTIADYHHQSIQKLIRGRGWSGLDTYARIGAAYSYVKDEIEFGYNRSDDLPASEVLKEGYGQCNTKGNLLLALLRALDVPCRFHGFTIYKKLQKGAIPSWMYPWAPKKILHSWVEVYFEGRWLALEGFILDRNYLSSLQNKFKGQDGAFCGYGVATLELHAPKVEWCGRDTYIQKEGIADDYGVFESPDEFYRERGTNLSGLKRWLYVYLFRHAMNGVVGKLREAGQEEGSPSGGVQQPRC